METSVTGNAKRPEIDAKIEAWVTSFVADEHPDGHEMMIGIRSPGGVLYRRISTQGMTEFLECVRFLSEHLGLKDELQHSSRVVKGCDAIFSLPKLR
ncbi:MAG: hypothetical protein JWN73_43 [Betaproteobacteria bacterium]|nr:hypothetical protein [Betaproteobacteria bacterium]